MNSDHPTTHAGLDGRTISVIALCYNHARFVVECLESIAGQTLQGFQLIVTDDASRDESPALIRDWIRRRQPDALFIEHKTNRGICATLNEALARVTGQYVAMVATDDRWRPDKLRQHLERMSTLGPTVAVLYSDAQLIDEAGAALEETFLSRHRPGRTAPSGQIFSDLADGNFIPAMATLIRVEALEVVGGYDEALTYEDYDMWLRLAAAGFEFQHLPSLVADYRIVASSMTNALFTRPSPAHSKTVVALHERWMFSGRLNPDQRRKWAKQIGAAAYNLWLHDDPSAAFYLRMAAIRTRAPRLAALAVLATLCVKRTALIKFLSRLGVLRH